MIPKIKRTQWIERHNINQRIYIHLMSTKTTLTNHLKIFLEQPSDLIQIMILTVLRGVMLKIKQILMCLTRCT